MRKSLVGNLAAALSCVAMVAPPSAVAVETRSRLADVALQPGGVLVGQVVDPQGVAKSGAVVSVQYADNEVVRTTTDANGVFAAQGLRGGQYQLMTDEGITVCRLWAPNTAPPAAQPAALVVSGDQAVRGQWGGGYGGRWLGWVRSHPYITAGVVAAAIAIPLALADNDDPSGS